MTLDFGLLFLAGLRPPEPVGTLIPRFTLQEKVTTPLPAVTAVKTGELLFLKEQMKIICSVISRSNAGNTRKQSDDFNFKGLHCELLKRPENETLTVFNLNYTRLPAPESPRLSWEDELQETMKCEERRKGEMPAFLPRRPAPCYWRLPVQSPL